MANRSRSLEVLVFTVGVGTLGSEIAAARLLAPWFGASTIVWANTIAIVLVALSIGYAIGGRFADRDPRPAGLAKIVLVAAALLAVVPFVSGPFLRQAVKAVDELSAATFLGSLVGVGVLLAVPLLLLGMVSPYAVRLSVDSVADAGRTAGRLSAIATVGSLAGTFSASLLLIPVVGTRRTFLIYAALMAIATLPHLLGRTRLLATGVPLVILGLMAIPTGTLKSSTSGEQVVWEKETDYQYARVLLDSAGQRSLELNEGHAVHSLYTPGEWLVGGYWDEMLALATTPTGGAPGSVAILGSAAGTTARAIGHYFPGARVDGVEIDGDITEVGKEQFDLAGPDLHTHTADARPWLQATDRTFDVIMVDAYRQPYIPFYLATEEFFALVAKRLNPGGVVIINVGHPADSDALEKVLTTTMATAFGQENTWRNAVSRTSTVLLGVTGADPREQLGRAAESVPAELGEVLDASALRLEPGLRGGKVYTDDRAPVEWLVDTSLAAEAE